MTTTNLDELQRLPHESVTEDFAECIASDAEEKVSGTATFRLTGICS
jgi:hypothetical protein